jgi:hypothetical protein
MAIFSPSTGRSCRAFTSTSQPRTISPDPFARLPGGVLSAGRRAPRGRVVTRDPAPGRASSSKSSDGSERGGGPSLRRKSIAAGLVSARSGRPSAPQSRRWRRGWRHRSRPARRLHDEVGRRRLRWRRAIVATANRRRRRSLRWGRGGAAWPRMTRGPESRSCSRTGAQRPGMARALCDPGPPGRPSTCAAALRGGPDPHRRHPTLNQARASGRATVPAQSATLLAQPALCGVSTRSPGS